MPIRDLIEDLGSQELETGIHVGVINSRGVRVAACMTAALRSGPLQRAFASGRVRQRLAENRLLRDLADSYEHDARREDARAERDANEG